VRGDVAGRGEDTVPVVGVPAVGVLGDELPQG
jgi:hypothetical protein